MCRQQASGPVSPLRRRMLNDMAMRGLHEDIQRHSIMSVRNFEVRWLRKSGQGGGAAGGIGRGEAAAAAHDHVRALTDEVRIMPSPAEPNAVPTIEVRGQRTAMLALGTTKSP